jgi:hypothetical protein
VIQTDIFKSYHRNDPEASVQAAKRSKRFKLTHQGRITEMLLKWPGKTANELERLSQGAPYHLSVAQIDRRISEMQNVRRDETVIRGGFHPLYLK